MRELHEEELKEVSGAWIAPVGGALLGVGTYAATAKITGKDITVQGALSAAAVGAITFGFGALYMNAAYVSVMAGFAGAAVYNAADYYMNLMC